MGDIDPRFLGGEPAVITDTSQMALALTINWDGAADIACQIDKPTAAKYLRMVADSLDPQDDSGSRTVKADHE